MEKIRAILIDDEPNCIGTLELLLKKYVPDIEISDTCKNGMEGISAIEKYQPHLIFLDIAMPKMNGFEMLAQIDSPEFEIIFTTAYDEYALKAFKVSAVDYLLKPIDKDELLASIEKVRRKIVLKTKAENPQPYPEQWHLFLENITQQNAPFPNIALPTFDGFEMIVAKDILYIEADGNYSTFYMREGRKILISRTLGEMEKVLSLYSFIRLHHSHLVNMTEIAKYVKGEGGYVILKNGQNINVSRRKKSELLKALKPY